jgi:hypothetical protein
MKKIIKTQNQNISNETRLKRQKFLVNVEDIQLNKKQFSDMLKYNNIKTDWVKLTREIVRGDDSRFIDVGAEIEDANGDPIRTFDWDEYYFYGSWDISLTTLNINLLPNIYTDVLIRYLGQTDIEYQVTKAMYFTQNGTLVNQGQDFNLDIFNSNKNRNLHLHTDVFVGVINPIIEDEKPQVINDFEASLLMGFTGRPLKQLKKLPNGLTVYDINKMPAG